MNPVAFVMARNTRYLIGILIASVILLAFVAPRWINGGRDAVTSIFPERVARWIPRAPEIPFRLGLDLLGGAHLLYEADLSGLTGISPEEAMQGVRDVVERRVNFFGVAEPLVQVSGENRLIVEIAGVTDVSEAIQLIGETPFLEFREQTVDEDGVPTQRLTVDESGELIVDPFGQWQPTGLSGKHVRRAQLVFDPQTGLPQVSLELNEEGAALFAAITRRNLGQPVAIFLDGQPISIPTVQSEITDGSAVISGDFTPTEAKQLVTRLNAGALPVPINLISQQTVGASLGEASLEMSLKAGLWGLVLVALFMIAFYRLPGVAAVVALGIYTLAVLAVYKLLPVTLTLAGIAGFILSLGMAVDANILIFARMKEELQAGRPLPVATNEGFRRAWLSIRDSHVTTLLGAGILYVFTTSVVKGFALTLGIGVLASLVTATIVTRTLLNPCTGKWGQQRPWLFR